MAPPDTKVDDPSFQVFERINDIYFMPGKKNVEAGSTEDGQSNNLEAPVPEESKTQNGCASLLPSATWSQMKYAKVSWSVRWTVKGLMPMRPHTIFTASVSVPAGHAFSL